MIKKLEKSDDITDYDSFYFYENGELKSVYFALYSNENKYANRKIVGISKYRNTAGRYSTFSRYLEEADFERHLNRWINDTSLEIYVERNYPSVWLIEEPKIMKSHKVTKPKTAVHKTVKKPATRKTKRA